MSEGTEPLSLDPHSSPCQGLRLQGEAGFHKKLCTFRVPHQAWGRARGSILRNLAAMLNVPSKVTCPFEPVFSGSSFLLEGGRGQTPL